MSGIKFLLSNNMANGDRQSFANLYNAQTRMQGMVWFASYWMGVETVLRERTMSKFAIGWKVLSVFGLAAVYQYGLNKAVGAHYSPLLGAYLRKYSEYGTANPQEIQDRKREFYQIDTTQYMSYSEEDLDIHGHANHGPQPVSFTAIFF